MTNDSFYLKNIWENTISSIKNSNKIDTGIVDAFFSDAKIYEANDKKVILLTENIIKNLY